MKKYYVYIMASKRNGTLYVGQTENLPNRINRHRKGIGADFTDEYKVKMLVYYEEYWDKKQSFVREKQLKKWNRQWKMRLIEEVNPEWEDLAEG